MSQGIVNAGKYVLSEREFIELTNLSKAQFLIMVQTKMTVMDCLNLRRAMQVAQTSYRKTHGPDDPRFMRSMEMWMKLERIARLNFMYLKMKEIYRYYPSWPRSTRKIEAKRQWEKFIRVNSY